MCWSAALPMDWAPPDLFEELLVPRYIRAAGRADLHKSEAALVGGKAFEEALDAAEALENTLGVIDAVDADAEQRRFDTQLRA